MEGKHNSRVVLVCLRVLNLPFSGECFNSRTCKLYECTSQKCILRCVTCQRLIAYPAHWGLQILCLCSLSWGALGPYHTPEPTGSWRKWKKLVAVTVALPVESSCIFLIYYCSVHTLASSVFKTGASVTITENTPCQLCCCTWMFHFYVQQFCWLSIRYILRHHVRLILYQTWSHSPFFSLGSEWSVKRIETMCTCSTDNCLHLLSGKTSQLFSCC